MQSAFDITKGSTRKLSVDQIGYEFCHTDWN